MADTKARTRLQAMALGAILFGLLVAAACSSADAGDTATADSAETNAAAADAAESGGADSGEGADSDDDTEAAPTAAADNPVLDGATVVQPDLDGPSSQMITLQSEPYVAAAVLPRPDYEANPWSQWGQGIALEDGRVIMGIGDHLGADGNSYLFVFDPEPGTITRIGDVLGSLDHDAGSWGYGKIHSQMVDAGDGGIYFTTYYGTRRNLQFDDSYRGDVLFRLDKETLELQPITIPVELHGVPTLASNGDGLIYGEAVDPLLDDDTYPEGGAFVYDTRTGSVLLFEASDEFAQFRNIMVSADGTAWFARNGGGLFRYEPDSNTIVEADIDLGSELRASTEPADDGTIYGITQKDVRQFFAFEPDGTVRTLGTAVDYTTSLALSPTQSSVLFVPGAHGDASAYGAPLIAVDTETGEQSTIVELAQMVRDEFGLVLGGTYSVTVDADTGHAHIGFNAGASADEPWGEVVFVVVELPR